MPKPMEAAVMELSDRLDEIRRQSAEAIAGSTANLLAMRLIVTELLRAHPVDLAPARQALADMPGIPDQLVAMTRSAIDTVEADADAPSD